MYDNEKRICHLLGCFSMYFFLQNTTLLIQTGQLAVLLLIGLNLWCIYVFSFRLLAIHYAEEEQKEKVKEQKEKEEANAPEE